MTLMVNKKDLPDIYSNQLPSFKSHANVHARKCQCCNVNGKLCKIHNNGKTLHFRTTILLLFNFVASRDLIPILIWGNEYSFRWCMNVNYIWDSKKSSWPNICHICRDQVFFWVWLLDPSSTQTEIGAFSLFLPNLHLTLFHICSKFSSPSELNKSHFQKIFSLDMIPDLQLFPFLPEIKFAKVTQFHNEWRWPVFQWISAKILLQQSKAFPPIHFHLHKGTTVLGSSGENGTYWLFHAQLFHFHDDNHQSYPL